MGIKIHLQQQVGKVCDDTLTGGNAHSDTFIATRCSQDPNKQANKNNPTWKSEYDPPFPCVHACLCVTGSH